MQETIVLHIQMKEVSLLSRRGKLWPLPHCGPSPSVAQYRDYEEAQRIAETLCVREAKKFQSNYGLHLEKVDFELEAGAPHVHVHVDVPGESDCKLEHGASACGRALVQDFGSRLLNVLGANPKTCNYRWHIDFTYEVLLTVRYGKISFSTNTKYTVMS